MDQSNIIVLKSAYGKTQGQTYHITPCVDPMTGMYPPCVRERDAVTGQLILSEADKVKANEPNLAKRQVFVASDVPIVVQHGTTFDLDNPLDRARWEAIKNSSLIAEDRFAKDSAGNYKVDGGSISVDEVGRVQGDYGIADLYVEHPGLAAKNRNDFRKLILQAQNFIANDTLDQWILKCKLLEKDMSRANSSDIEDWLFTQAEKYPQKIIDLYTGNSTKVRLLLVEAIARGVIVKKDGLYYFGDDIVIGRGQDRAVEFLQNPDNKVLYDQISKETFPELQKKTK